MKLRTSKQTFTVEIEDITVTAQPLTPHETSALRKRFTKNKGRGLDRREKFEGNNFTEAMFIAVVKSWEGAVDDAGKPLPCNPETKKEVYKYDQDFVADVLEGIRDAVSDREEADLKN